MMIPVRCFTCGKVIAEHWDEFQTRTEQSDEDVGAVLDDLGIKRHCCRRMMISHRDLVDVVAPYQ